MQTCTPNVRYDCTLTIYPSHKELVLEENGTTYHDIEDIPFDIYRMEEITYFRITKAGNLLVTFGGLE